MNELPPLPQSFTILSRLQSGTEEVVSLDIVREYGRACEHAAYMRAAAACRAQKNPPPVLVADQVHYDPANAMAERCAAVISLLGADK